MSGDLGQCYLVKLEPGLNASRLVGIFHNVRLLPGVQSVTDLAAITAETLQAVLLSVPDPEPEVPSVAQEALL